MKKILILVIAAAAAAAAAQAQAQTYSRAVKVQEYCSNMGKRGVEIYATGRIEGATREEWEKFIKDNPKDNKGAKEVVKLFKLIEKEEPDSGHNAYMQAWAACMDKYN